MEMDDGLEMNEAPLLAIGRQGYGLGSGDLECQASNSHWPAPVCSGSNGSSKKSRMDEGEFWHRANAFGHDSWRTFSSEPSQTQALPGMQRPKRQNCSGSMQGCWDSIPGNMNSLDETGSGLNRTSMDIEGNLGQSSRAGLIGYCDAVDQGPRSAGFDFLRTGPDVAGSSSSSSFLSGWVAGNGAGEALPSIGSTLVEDKLGSWSGATGSHSVGLRLGDISSSLVCYSDGSSSEGKSAGDLMVNSLVNSPETPMGTGFMMDYQNIEVQPPLSGNVGDQSGSAEAENMYLRAGLGEGSCCLDPSICSYSSSLPEAEGGKAPLPIGSLVGSTVDNTGSSRLGHVNGGKRGSCKRKSSTPGLADPLSFRAPQSSGRRESNLIRSVGGSGPSRPELSGVSCAAAPDVFHSMSTTPMIQIWDDPHNARAGFVGNESDLLESLRGNGGKTVTLSGTGGSSQRTVRNRSVSMQQEQSHSQLHSLFARNLRRSMPASQSQALFSRRVSSAEQSVEPGGNGVSNTGATHEADHWSPSAFSQRSATSSAVASWGGNNPFSRSSNSYSSFVAPLRERSSSTFEGSRVRGMSGRAPSWVGAAAMESRLPNQTGTSRGVAASTARAMNPPESSAHATQVASSLFYPSVAASSHLSALLSTRRNSGASDRNMPPPTSSSAASNHPGPFGASSLEVISSSAAMYPGPCSSASRPSLFVDGHGEGILAAPVQSLLGMPFRGLHMLPAEGEHRHRFVSEILSALEHARRSEDLSFEELVMLDPSLIYGGIDMHDQHSDMRLDVDNMSYEELLALEERIGNVSTGLTEETITKCLRESKYSSLDLTVASISQESDMKCSICQEEYEEEDELGRLDCGHSYHTTCIRQWLTQKNQCPICKAAAVSKS